MNFRAIVGVAAIALTACGGGGGGGGQPISPNNQIPEFVFCRAHVESAESRSELRQATRFGLGAKKIIDRSGVETGARVAPDGVQVAYSRNRRRSESDTREIYVAYSDGSEPERALTRDGWLDDAPCWSPDGSLILFSSERFESGRRLFTMSSADGKDIAPLHDDGTEQRDPDWSASTNRIVFSRIDPTETPARARLFTIDAEGRSPVALTDGGTGLGIEEIPGDYEPAFSPDGSTVVFSRAVSDQVRTLLAVEVASGTVVPVTTGAVVDRFPRYSPRGDLLFFARGQLDVGIPALRLHTCGPDGREPRLLFPDERFDYLGFDAFPDMPAAGGDRLVDEWAGVVLDEDDVAVAGGARVGGIRDSVLVADGASLVLETRTFDNRDIAAVRVTGKLLGAEPEDVLAVEVSVRAAIDPVAADSILRVTIRNAVEGRNDKVLEITPRGPDLEDYAFTIGSLAHVSRRREVVVQVIGDMRKDARGRLLVDHVQIRFKKPVVIDGQ